MKFWCASAKSSKHEKALNKKVMKSHDSSSSLGSYATISSISIRKSDSGFSESTSSIPTLTFFEQILVLERTYHETLKEYISKYSRPLRRYLNPTEIVDLFQNIEKISAISQSIVRHCEKLLDDDSMRPMSIAMIYQPFFDIMKDSYTTFLSRSVRVQDSVKQYSEKIAYFLQIPDDIVTWEITDFVLLPIRHIGILNDLFELFVIDHYSSITNNDWNIIHDIRFLSKEGNILLESTSYDQMSVLESSKIITSNSKLSPIIVLQRMNKEAWEPKQIELSDSNLLLTKMNRVSSIHLSNVVHIEEDSINAELCIILASTISPLSRSSSIKMKRLYIRFQANNDYCMWLNCLKYAVKDAKDRNWTMKNELVI